MIFGYGSILGFGLRVGFGNVTLVRDDDENTDFGMLGQQ